MSELDRQESRLDNIQSVEPILAAMKTISMGSQQAALNQRNRVRAYFSKLSQIQSFVSYQLKMTKTVVRSESSVDERMVLLAIGSERGLCGQFNRLVLDATVEKLDLLRQLGWKVELWVLGKRLLRLFQSAKIPVAYFESLSITSLPSYPLAVRLSWDWLKRYENQTIDRVEVLFYGLKGKQIQTVMPAIADLESGSFAEMEEDWVHPIIETDPSHLIQRILEQVVISQTYSCLLESAAAEHSARFRLMDEATQNSQRLIEQLQMELLTGKRQVITREMQELAVGAGLLKR